MTGRKSQKKEDKSLAFVVGCWNVLVVECQRGSGPKIKHFRSSSCEPLPGLFHMRLRASRRHTNTLARAHTRRLNLCQSASESLPPSLPPRHSLCLPVLRTPPGGQQGAPRQLAELPSGLILRSYYATMHD